jgi:hypothetical protein
VRQAFPVFTTLALCAAGLGGTRPAAPVEVRICAGLSEAVTDANAPVLLVFFSIECSACYEELFESRYLIDKGGWPVAVVGVTLALRDDLEAFLEKHAWTAPVVLDRRKSLFRRFKVDGVPLSILVVGGEALYRDDPYLGAAARRKELSRCLTRLFSR